MSKVPLSEIPVEMLERLAIRCDGYAYFSQDSFDSHWTPNGIEPPHPEIVKLLASVLPKLVTAFEVTYSPRIWNFAGELCNYLVFHSRLLDSDGVAEWKKSPTLNDRMDLIDCLGGIIRLGTLGQHKPWWEWALKGIQHQIRDAENETGWTRRLFTEPVPQDFVDLGAKEALLCLWAVPYDMKLWDAVETRYFNPPQLVRPSLTVDPVRFRLMNKEAVALAVLKQEQERIQVNLWASYQDDSITVASGMPEKGWLSIEAPATAQVSLRIPNWLSLNTVQINDVPISEVLLKLQPGFMDLPIPMKNTEKSLWKIEFAVPSQTREFHISPTTYEAVWRGPYINRFSLKDRSVPIFERPRSLPTARPSSISSQFSKSAQAGGAKGARKTAALTARLTMVSITEAPLFSTQELLLYLDKCVMRSGLQRLPNSVSRTAMDVERMYEGRWPGMTPCSLPYHDLKHTWTVTAALGDLLYGMRTGGLAITTRHFEFALIAMLLHGTGALNPGAKSRRHYELSAEFSTTYLSRLGNLFAPQTQEIIRLLILCTGYDAQLDFVERLDPLWQQVAHAMGTAKLLGQMASADYLDRLPELFDELNATPGGTTSEIQPQSVQDLPSYFRNFVVKSLNERYGMVYMYYQFLSADHRNRYLESVEKNIHRVEKARRAPGN